ncbi:hypothetical protein PRUPE_6G036100 [Prunus persica]|uniref:Uncharacterized protein n=1 Tax=Prunus persica TaxID=3760 RepID=A0A251NJQ4_PRUPE|nr:hypothetical protein PRUPE_6G036100 [Prunus persica]
MRRETLTSSDGRAVLGRCCKCLKEALIRTSWTDLNSRRREVDGVICRSGQTQKCAIFRIRSFPGC